MKSTRIWVLIGVIVTCTIIIVASIWLTSTKPSANNPRGETEISTDSSPTASPNIPTIVEPEALDSAVVTEVEQRSGKR